MRNIAKFTSPDSTQNLIVTAITGKSGINVKVTMKGREKGGPRAVTGCRGRYIGDKDAQKAFDKLVKETEDRGWTRQTTRVRNAFTEIPEPPKAVKGAKKGAKPAKPVAPAVEASAAVQ